MNNYRVLSQQAFEYGDYQLVPIRKQDRYDIMKWRNEQMYHLRQSTPLTKNEQDRYFEEVVDKLYTKSQPDQILFSYLEGDCCIGYGGLVHIDWVNKNAEISFVIDTSLEKTNFEFHWKTYLTLIEKVAFEELKLHKIFTYAYDVRRKLFKALEGSGYIREAILKDHCMIDQKFVDVVYHSKININDLILFRKATLDDARLLFDWANDPGVRINSFSQDKIEWDHHLKWFKEKLESKLSKIFIFFICDQPIGQVRIDWENDSWGIDYSVDKEGRGQGLGTKMLKMVIESEPIKSFHAIVLSENVASQRVFEKLGFKKIQTKAYYDQDTLEYKY